MAAMGIPPDEGRWQGMGLALQRHRDCGSAMASRRSGGGTPGLFSWRLPKN